MTIYLVIPLLLALAILQATVVPHLTVLHVFADLPLVAVAGWGLMRGAREGVIWGFVGGVAVDLLSGAPFGAACLGLMAAGFLAGLGKRSAVGARLLLPLAVALLATLAYDLLFLVVVAAAGQHVAWWEALYRIILPSAVLNAALLLLLFPPLHSLYARLQAEDAPGAGR